ncbi:MAG: TRAP transporter small permease subunit [Gammaproteobacteria bacterium]
MLSTLKHIRDALDRFTNLSGRLVSWLVLVLVILVSYDVTNRHLFQSGSIAIQEWEWHLFSLIFLLGAAYTLQQDDHVRLDLFYKSHFMNDYRRAWINLLGSVFFLLPFCVLIIISSWPFILQAYTSMEGSPDPGGLTHRWLLKAAIPGGFLLLIIQGISHILTNLLYILTGERQ